MPSSLYVPLCVSFPVHAGAKPISDILTHKDFFYSFQHHVLLCLHSSPLRAILYITIFTGDAMCLLVPMETTGAVVLFAVIKWTEAIDITTRVQNIPYVSARKFMGDCI